MQGRFCLGAYIVSDGVTSRALLALRSIDPLSLCYSNRRNGSVVRSGGCSAVLLEKGDGKKKGE